MKIVAISDTHNRHKDVIVPECDILIHCGDYSSRGRETEVKSFYNWLNKQPAKHKISIQGNHEIGWEHYPDKMKEVALDQCPDAILLHDSGIEIEGKYFYGMSWTPEFFNWAYNAARTDAEAVIKRIPRMKEFTEMIPEQTDVLISHGPPYKILDELVHANGDPSGRFVGCADLYDKVMEVKPDLHFFGHIHCGHGEKHVDGISFYNVSICDEQYSPTYSPTIIEYTD